MSVNNFLELFITLSWKCYIQCRYGTKYDQFLFKRDSEREDE